MRYVSSLQAASDEETTEGERGVRLGLHLLEEADRARAALKLELLALHEVRARFLRAINGILAMAQSPPATDVWPQVCSALTAPEGPFRFRGHA
jgi:hypothetical protein